MLFHPLDIPGALLLVPERVADRRGFFARRYCRRQLEQRGLDPTIVRSEISVTKERGTVRGMHYQAAPFEELQLVRCTMGAVFAVAVDLRPDSPAFKRHVGIELSKANRQALYLPAGVGHGFQTLEDGAEVFFQKSELLYPDCARGVRWNDPALDIQWPRAITTISEQDLTFPDLES